LEVLKRAEQGEVVLENQTVAVEDENESTLEDQVHTAPSVKSEDIQSVRQNDVSKGSNIGRKAKMIKMIMQMQSKCPLEVQSMERAINLRAMKTK
jgi:hypothetical protein